MLDEFVAAENLLERAGLFEAELPIPLRAVTGYLAKEGLELLNKAKGERSWDSFVSEAVAEHYGLDLGVIALPPSKFLAEREERREAEKAKKPSGKKAKAKVEKRARKSANKTDGQQST